MDADLRVAEVDPGRDREQGGADAQYKLGYYYTIGEGGLRRDMAAATKTTWTRR